MSLPVLGLGADEEADSGYDTTDITMWWRCESATFDSTKDYSAGDTVAELLGSAAINTDAVKNGTNGLDCPSSGSRAAFETDVTDIVTSAEGRIGFWLQLNSSSNSRIGRLVYDGTNQFLFAADGANRHLYVQWWDGGTSRASYPSANSTLSAAGNWDFVEFAWKTSTNYRQLFINGTSITAHSGTIGSFSSAATQLAFGDSVGSAGTNLFIDAVRVTKDSTKSLYESRDQLNYDNS